MPIEEYAEPPRLGSLYRSAVLGAVRPGTGGDTLPDAEIRVPELKVDRGHLAGYERVCGFRISDSLPATYPHVLAFPLAVALMTRPGFPLPLVGLVHVANRIDLLRPLTADDVFEFRVHAEDLRPHERGRQVDLVAEGLVGGEPVWVGRSTYLRKEQKPGDGPRSAEPPRPPAGAALWRVSPRFGTAYAAVSGDRNPIHTSRLGARMFGFSRPIAHGMWTKARCLAALEGRLPDRYTVDVAFKLPVPLPSTVAFSAVRQHTVEGDYWRLGLVAATSGKPHLSGHVIHRA